MARPLSKGIVHRPLLVVGLCARSRTDTETVLTMDVVRSLRHRPHEYGPVSLPAVILHIELFSILYVRDAQIARLDDHIFRHSRHSREQACAPHCANHSFLTHFHIIISQSFNIPKFCRLLSFHQHSESSPEPYR